MLKGAHNIPVVSTGNFETFNKNLFQSLRRAGCGKADGPRSHKAVSVDAIMLLRYVVTAIMLHNNNNTTVANRNNKNIRK